MFLGPELYSHDGSQSVQSRYRSSELHSRCVDQEFLKLRRNSEIPVQNFVTGLQLLLLLLL